MTKRLQYLTRDVAVAQAAVIEELKKCYPKGSWWAVRIRYGQQTLTPMQVTDYEGGVHAIVRFSVQMNPGRYGQNKGRFFRRSVPAKNIVSILK